MMKLSLSKVYKVETVCLNKNDCVPLGIFEATSF